MYALVGSFAHLNNNKFKDISINKLILDLLISLNEKNKVLKVFSGQYSGPDYPGNNLPNINTQVDKKLLANRLKNSTNNKIKSTWYGDEIFEWASAHYQIKIIEFIEDKKIVKTFKPSTNSVNGLKTIYILRKGESYYNNTKKYVPSQTHFETLTPISN